MYTRSQRLLAVGYGVACHVAFAASVAAMMVALYTGLHIGLGGRLGLPAPLLDLALLAQFALAHSFMLSARGRAWLARLAPLGLGPALTTTTFALVSSLLLGLTFLAWAPLGGTWWEPHGVLRVAFVVVYGLSWLLLLKTMADAGIELQTGMLGWKAVALGRRPAYGGFSPRGTFRHVRQPIYVAFALILWTGPVWTVDHLLAAVGWTAYCLLGPLWKEQRYLGLFGEPFAHYRALVPYWIPRVRAADVSLVEAVPDGSADAASPAAPAS